MKSNRNIPQMPSRWLTLLVLLLCLAALSSCDSGERYTVDVVFMIDSMPVSEPGVVWLDRVGIMSWLSKDNTFDAEPASDSYGHAHFEGIPRGRYRLRCNYIATEEVNPRVNVRSNLVLDTIWLTSPETEQLFVDMVIQDYRKAHYEGCPTGNAFRDSYYALRHALDSIPFVHNLDDEGNYDWGYHLEGDDNCTSLLALLSGVRMERGWEMCAQYVGLANGNCFLLARRGDSDTKLGEHLEVEFTEQGIWNALLLDMSCSFLPCEWHGCAQEMSIIFDTKEILAVPEIQKAGGETLFGQLREHLTKANVKIENKVNILDADHAVIDAYCWHDWIGLYIDHIQVERHGKKVSFRYSKREDFQVIVPFDNGVEY